MSRIKQTFTQNTDGTENISVTCKICGKPIVKSNKYGMYCEDMCGLKEDKETYDKLNNIFMSIFK
jgi:ribosomal protein L37AE/L43A